MCLHGVFGQRLLPSSPGVSFLPALPSGALRKPFLRWPRPRSCGRRPALFSPLPIGSLPARVFRSKTVLCNSFQQSNNPPLQRSSSLIQLTSQNSSPNQQRTPQVIGVMQSQNSSAGSRGPRPLEQVTCYKVSPGAGGGVFHRPCHPLLPQRVSSCGRMKTSLFLLIGREKQGHSGELDQATSTTH